ncbi:MAG: F0F1 ATP synthase subunit A, partial [Cetobacterium sp.]
MRIGPIEFITPPLVEGPAVMFYVPLPHFLHQIPFSMEYADGKFGLPVTITVISTWFVILVLTLLFKMGTKKLEMIPGRAQVAAESVYDFLHGIIHQMLGGWTAKYFSYLAT